jgi:hypothetical protein
MSKRPELWRDLPKSNTHTTLRMTNIPSHPRLYIVQVFNPSNSQVSSQIALARPRPPCFRNPCELFPNNTIKIFKDPCDHFPCDPTLHMTPFSIYPLRQSSWRLHYMSEIFIVKKVRVKHINHHTLIHDRTFEYLPHFFLFMSILRVI